MDAATAGTKTFFSTLSQALNQTESAQTNGYEHISTSKASIKLQRLHRSSQGAVARADTCISPFSSPSSFDGASPSSPSGFHSSEMENDNELHRPHTAPANIFPPELRPRPRAQSQSLKSYLNLTTFQAEMRKWSYAAYTYMVTALLILLPVRLLIQDRALDGEEPFEWAIAYLFGDIPRLYDHSIDGNCLLYTS